MTETPTMDAAVGVSAPAALRSVAIVIVSFNSGEFVEACLHSISGANATRHRREVIVVDNHSTDGTRERLRGHSEASIRLFENDANLGFAAGNNVGLAAATGEVLVMLNNDTYVTPGWVRTLCAHLRREPTLGLVGPVTNNIGNEARIEIQYRDMDDPTARLAKQIGLRWRSIRAPPVPGKLRPPHPGRTAAEPASGGPVESSREDPWH